jgi:glycerate kinase
MESEMKVLIAPDKFKGSLTAAQVVDHIGAGLAQRGIGHLGLPLADGGDGSVAAAVAAGFRPVEVDVASASGERHTAAIAFDGVTAVVEVANTCGLHTLPRATMAPLRSSSAGVGDAVRAALRLGAKRIVLALGGSASTDGGAGMLAVLGAEFRDDAGRALTADGGALGRIHTVDLAGLPDLSQTEIVIASDVQNPLTGPDGAAAVYGPQKGADPGQVAALDAGLAHLVDRLIAAGNRAAGRLAATPGAGAAGGLGFAGMLLGGHPVSGADYFLDLLQFEAHLHGCDLVITGEGRIDDQTLHGKLPAIVARRADPVPVIAVVGRSDLSESARHRMGLAAVHAIADRTSRNPARDPALSARLLEELGRTMPLPTRPMPTP